MLEWVNRLLEVQPTGSHNPQTVIHFHHKSVVNNLSLDTIMTVHMKRAHFTHLVIFEFLVLNKTRLHELTVDKAIGTSVAKL